MGTTIHLHPKPEDFSAGHGAPGKYHPAYATVDMESGDVEAVIFLDSAAKCDALIKAAVEAKRLLLGDDDPAVLITSEQPAPNLDTANLPAAEADPANPYGSSKHGRFDAGSAAEVAEGTEPFRISPESIAEAERVGNEWPDGVHTCAELQVLEPGRRPCTCGRCPVIAPFPRLPHLPQHVGGNPMCSLCGLDHYALHAIETTGGAR